MVVRLAPAPGSPRPHRGLAGWARGALAGPGTDHGSGGALSHGAAWHFAWANQGRRAAAAPDPGGGQWGQLISGVGVAEPLTRRCACAADRRCAGMAAGP